MARARAREQQSLATAARAQVNEQDGNEQDGAMTELQRLRAERRAAAGPSAGSSVGPGEPLGFARGAAEP